MLIELKLHCLLHAGSALEVHMLQQCLAHQARNHNKVALDEIQLKVMK